MLVLLIKGFEAQMSVFKELALRDGAPAGTLSKEGRQTSVAKSSLSGSWEPQSIFFFLVWQLLVFGLYEPLKYWGDNIDLSVAVADHHINKEL